MTYVKIKDMQYKRIDRDEAIDKIKKITDKIKNASSAADVVEARKEYCHLSDEISTMSSLAHTRFNLNTLDEYYNGEVEYYDNVLPELQIYFIEYEKAFLNSKYLEEVKKQINPLVITMYQLSLKCADKKILKEMQEEMRLTTKYSKFVSEQLYLFRGREVTLGELRKYMQDSDRKTREEAYNALGATLEKNADFIDTVFDEMVKVRTKMAQKLGYKNFIELGYNRMARTCYDQDTVKIFRENVLNDIVPVVCRLKKKIADKLGINEMKLYDNDTYFKEDPKPISNAQGILESGKEMYHEMSKETAGFIDMMFESDAFDVLPRKGKWTGGYMTSFPLYKQPFIFANFNGTTADVDVITHEAGHAFAYYLGADDFTTELDLGGMETAETHSMSMEFFAWKYMDKFFGKDEAKYRYKHLADALTFIPYGTIVDYFQHIVYENPDLTPEQRKAEWKKLEQKFRPYMNADGITYLELGTRWQYQNHIFESPFYYIDYCLAQTVAIEFLEESFKDYDGALKRYFDFARKTGNYKFTELVKAAGLKSPFEEGALKEVAATCEKLLDDLATQIKD